MSDSPGIYHPCTLLQLLTTLGSAYLFIYFLLLEKQTNKYKKT